MKKRQLAILRSPHKNGSTAAMLHCALKIAVSHGQEITIVSLYEQQILFCNGCRICIKTGQCILNEDLREIAKLIKTCDRVILSDSTYWSNFSAAVKNFFDRLLGTATEETATFPSPRLSE